MKLVIPDKYKTRHKTEIVTTNLTVPSPGKSGPARNFHKSGKSDEVYFDRTLSRGCLNERVFGRRDFDDEYYKKDRE